MIYTVFKVIDDAVVITSKSAHTQGAIAFNFSIFVEQSSHKAATLVAGLLIF